MRKINETLIRMFSLPSLHLTYLLHSLNDSPTDTIEDITGQSETKETIKSEAHA